MMDMYASEAFDLSENRVADIDSPTSERYLSKPQDSENPLLTLQDKAIAA